MTACRSVHITCIGKITPPIHHYRSAPTGCYLIITLIEYLNVLQRSRSLLHIAGLSVTGYQYTIYVE